MKKRRRRYAMLMLSALLLCLGVSVYGERAVGETGAPGVRQWKEEDGEIYVSVPLSHYRHKIIRLWWNENEQKYYLFLPSFWREEDKLKLWVGGGGRMSLDGAVLSGGRMQVCVGLHTLEADGETYLLEVMASRNVPALFIEMEEEKLESLGKEPYEQQYGAQAMLVNPEGYAETEAKIEGLRVRGNTSADWVKKPYQMTMHQATDFLGMGGAVKWNLLSNWSDKTLLRNKITYDMAAQAGMPYSPESGFVDLYLNGSYEGCYQLCEKVEIGPGRVDIRNLEEYTLYEPTEEEADPAGGADAVREEPEQYGVRFLENGISLRGYETQTGTEDITGGYLLEIERPSRIYASASFFITRGGQPVTIKRPKYADYAQAEYIAGLWQTFEDALYAEDGVNPGTGLKYTAYIDLESFVKKYLVEEIVRNYDASSTSQYFYKDMDAADEKLYAGPVWDYDMSLGNPIMNPRTNQHYISSVSPYGLFAALPMDPFSIWYHMYEKEEFRKETEQTYEAVFLPILQGLEEGGVDALARELAPSAMMDGVRWGRNKGTDPDGRAADYQESIRELTDFIRLREGYLTGLWVEGRESKKVYLDGGDGDLYISYVEGLVGDVLEVPLAPEKEGYTFVRWLNGYTKEPYAFGTPYDGSDLYFVAEYRSDTDGSILIAGE